MSDPSWPDPKFKKGIASNLARLRAARRSMGAKEHNVGELEPEPPGFGSGTKLDGKGIREILSRNPNSSEPFNREGKPFVMHLYKPRFWKSTFEAISEEPKIGPRFHLTHCTTLTEMVAKIAAEERYIGTEMTDGKFICYLTKGVSQEDCLVGLLPCRYCLRALNHKQYSSKSSTGRNKIVDEFDVKEWLEENKPMFRFRPRYTPETYQEENDYPPGWSELSRRVRESYGWKCQKCGVYCGDNKGLLHTHHKDGNKKNNKSSNLLPLCLDCHSFEPNHGHMRSSQADMNQLRKIQKKQGIEWKCQKCGVDCSENRGLLHIHHKDGNKKNNKSSNLQVLCLDCHSLEHGPLLTFPG